MTDQFNIPLYDTLKRASDFVIDQKGKWDHTAWSDFLSNINLEKPALNTAEMEAQIGQTLEAIKAYHHATASTRGVNDAMYDLMSDVAEFVTAHNGIWGQSEWEEFLQTIQEDASTWNEQRVAYLGGVLESAKGLYTVSSTTAGSKKATEVSGTEKSTRKKKA